MMSHDQKPSRVRVLDAGAGTPVRRRGDHAPVIIDDRSTVAPGRRGPGAVGTILFLAGAAIGGAGIAFLGITRP